MKIKKFLLQNRKLCVVVDFPESITEDEFLDSIGALLQKGVDMVVFGKGELSDCRMIELCKKIRVLCSLYDSLFIVRDRIDIAKIVEADGVHLVPDGVDILSARGIMDEQSICGIGLNEQDVILAAKDADYIVVDFVSKELECCLKNFGITAFSGAEKSDGNVEGLRVYKKIISK